MAALERNLQTAKWTVANNANAGNTGSGVPFAAVTAANSVVPVLPNSLVAADVNATDFGTFARVGIVPYCKQQDCDPDGVYTDAWSLAKQTGGTTRVLVQPTGYTGTLTDVILIATEDLLSVDVETTLNVTALAASNTATPYVKGFYEDGSEWTWLAANSVTPTTILSGSTVKSEYKLVANLGMVPKGYGFVVGVIFGQAVTPEVIKTSMSAWIAKRGRD